MPLVSIRGKSAVSKRGAPASSLALRLPDPGAALLLLLAGGLLVPAPAWAVDEIQVYNAEINRPGQFSLQLHGNYVARGRTEPEFPGGLVPDESFNGTPEFAYGVNEWWEIGAYLPYAVASGEGFEWGGAKLRTLFVSPRAADRSFFYGVNLELSWAAEKFSPGHWGSEVRPIVGWRGRKVEFILNPILEVPLSGDQGAVTFAPAARLAWIATSAWTLGLEHYSDLGPLRNFSPRDEQLQELFAVADFSGRGFDADFGVGRGFTPASDDWTVKFILGWSF
jgi:hypothetical protein